MWQDTFLENLKKQILEAKNKKRSLKQITVITEKGAIGLFPK